MAEDLFAEFAAATREDWLAAARASLRGAPLTSLTASTYEGIDIQPLQGPEAVDGGHLDSLPGQFPFRRGTAVGGYRQRAWLIAQDIDEPAPAQFNAALRVGLANGQTAITLGNGLKLEGAPDARRALAGVDLGRFPLFIGSRAPGIYRLLKAALSEEEIRGLRGWAGYDPLAELARTGRMPADAFERLKTHVALVAEGSPWMASIGLSAAPYHAAGAAAGQELALILATGVAYFRALSERGIKPGSAAGKMRVELCIGENFFMEVAKLRAVKLLWAQMTRAFGLDEGQQRIRLHARSGARNKTRRDQYVNLLRLTVEALAAALGGVDSLGLAPFDAPLGETSEFSRRLSRNLQLILQEEAGLTQLIDPAGGAWHIERLTDELASQAWARFQRIEAAGGLLAALQAGMIQAEIGAIAERRRQDLRKGETVLVGVNRYVNSAEAALRRGPVEAREAPVDGALLRVAPLRPLRLEEEIEAAGTAQAGG